MDCLILTPHKLGIREVAERVGAQWEAMGHDVEYIFSGGTAAQFGPVTVGAVGIAQWWYRRLRRVAANHERYDLIWVHQPVLPILPTTETAFWNKVILTAHTTTIGKCTLVQEGTYPIRLLPYYWLLKTVERRFHARVASLDTEGPHYTAVAPHIGEELTSLGVLGMTIIPNGLPNQCQSAPPSIRTEFDIPADATLVFNIGSHTRQKRPVFFADRLRQVTTLSEDVYVVMAGDGPLHDAVAARASDRLLVIGRIDEATKWRWFADADIFASLSAYEGMPVSALEALSFGLPVVLSDIPAHRHLIDRYGAAGTLVSETVDEIASAIRQQSDQRSDTSLPTWEEVAARYLGLLE